MRNRIIKILSSFLIFTIVIILAEFLFKIKFKPGYQTHLSGFVIVDSLIVYSDYSTDTFGNYVLSTIVTDSLHQQYNHKNCFIENSKIANKISNYDGIKAVLRDFCNLKQRSFLPFEVFSDSILQSSSLDEVGNAYKNYINWPFNKNGFRSIEFVNHITDKNKILLIGDSFTWGMSAKPYYQSFADLLSTKGYVVYNAGISGVDPLQYYNTILNYTSMIDPDVILINFYEGNDLIQYPREMEYNKPHEHITNAGMYHAWPEGEYLNAEEAHKYYLDNISIPKTSWSNHILSSTSIGSIIWTLINPSKRANFYNKYSEKEKIDFTNQTLGKMLDYANSCNLKLIFSVIPSDDNAINQLRKDKKYMIDTNFIDQIFRDIEYHAIRTLDYKDYNGPNDLHFNSSGMSRYADYLDSLIQNKLN